ncbi:MAG: response regulator transcription factor [Pseudonocardia sp.]|nr:response regulator transcription factor [Pseudonocardia sp.]
MDYLLVVEDRSHARLRLIDILISAGYSASCVRNGRSALRAVLGRRPGLVLLDVSTPGGDLPALLPKLREVASDLPVIVVAGNDDESKMIAALDAGADDYLVRPFGPGALLARVRAVLRRTAGADAVAPNLVLGGLAIDRKTRTAELEGRPLSLSPKEFDLLSYLASRAGQVVSRRELLNEVWRMPYSQADRTVDVHVSWLRRKLRESGKAPRYLHTVRGAGLRLDVPRMQESVTS